MVDPLDVLAPFVRDSLPPMAHAFMACPVAGKGVFCGSSAKQSFPFSSHTVTRTLTAWGKIGLAIWANDYSEATYNHYGVRETILTVDGHEIFHSVVDNIPIQRNRMVNSWGDYDHYFRTGVWFMKSFLSPGTRLPILKTDGDKGIIEIREEREYHVCYTLRDIHGNTSRYSFVIRGERSNIPTADSETPGVLPMRWNKTCLISLPGMQLVLPSGNLPDDIIIRPTIKKRSTNSYSAVYSFYKRSFPLFRHAELSLAVCRKMTDPTKFYVVSHYDYDRFMGGRYADGWVTADIRDLGASYELEYDDCPPTISPLNQSSWIVNDAIRFVLSDDKSGVKSFCGYIDDQFVLFEQETSSTVVTCRLRNAPIRKNGRIRHLKFIATDNRDNTATFECDLIY